MIRNFSEFPGYPGIVTQADGAIKIKAPCVDSDKNHRTY